MMQQREMVAELMDAPGLDARAHDEALAGLRRLNAASRAARVMGREVVDWARRREVTEGEMLDVACGGGDVPVEVAGILRRAGVVVRMVLSDRSGTALELARRAAEGAGIEARVVAGEAPEGLPSGVFEVVTNSLFLHHLKREEVVGTLREMGRRVKAGGILVVSDLRRSVVGWGVAWVMCRILSRSAIVHFDGPVSVRAAWTVDEMRAMASEAGLVGARVGRCWPWRMLLVWERV